MDIETFYPKTEKEIQDFLAHAREKKRHVYVFSCGQNWGYGGCQSPVGGALIMSLEKMNRIISFDKELGVVELEPGVTQGQLEDYLSKENLSYFVPNTGAGSRGSIVGNALERGFGVAPISDHASAMVNIRGVLGGGEIYESPLNEVSKDLCHAFPWGVGLCTDKLISQSSWIVITRVSVQLVKKKPCSDTLVFKVKNSRMNQVIDGLRELSSDFYGNLSSIKIFDSQQIQKSFYSDSSHDRHWFIFVGFYSFPRTRHAIKNEIKKRLVSQADLCVLVNQKRIYWFLKIFNFLPSSLFKAEKQRMFALLEYQKMVDGQTSEIGFHVLDNTVAFTKEKAFNMDNFPKQIAWLSPLCPMKFENFAKLINWLEGLERSAPCEFRSKTWTTLNVRCMALVICLVFDKTREKEFWEWYNRVLIDMKQLGFIPYRYPLQSYTTLQNQLLPKHFRIVSQIEKSLDPEDVIQKNRYHY